MTVVQGPHIFRMPLFPPVMPLSWYREVLQVRDQFWLGGDRFRKFKLTSAQTLFGCNTNLTADYSDIIGNVTICGASRDNRGI